MPKWHKPYAILAQQKCFSNRENSALKPRKTQHKPKKPPFLQALKSNRQLSLANVNDRKRSLATVSHR